MSPTGIPRPSLRASSRGVHRTVKGHYSENARFRPSMHALGRTRGRPVQWLKFPWHRRNLSTGRSFLVPIIPLRWLCYQVPPISRFPVAAHLRSKIKGAFGSILRTKKEPPCRHRPSEEDTAYFSLTGTKHGRNGEISVHHLRYLWILETRVHELPTKEKMRHHARISMLTPYPARRQLGSCRLYKTA